MHDQESDIVPDAITAVRSEILRSEFCVDAVPVGEMRWYISAVSTWLPNFGLLGAALLLGCPSESHIRVPRPLEDGGVPLVDTDQDGLCDETERLRGLLPDDSDTDDDGYPDGYEGLMQTNAVLPSEPDRTRVLVAQRGGPTAIVTEELNVYGIGQSFTAFVAGEITLADATRTAESFVSSSGAVSADPPSHVGAVESDTFRTVNGETVLRFRVVFEPPADAAPGCARAYPFRHVIKRDDGRIMRSTRYYLIVLPEGTGPLAAETEWCRFGTRCI